jgi:hypothetical protein
MLVFNDHPGNQNRKVCGGSQWIELFSLDNCTAKKKSKILLLYSIYFTQIRV